ncbi:MAG: pyridoxal 5'-phosphate synthase glutaminase subunit PdxT [Chloroflexota bacterium]
MTRIGVLALQGDVAEHMSILAESEVEPVAVKRTEQLDEIDGLVIPGGESTTIGKLLRRFDLLGPLRERVRDGFPVYGTCAGMILLADQVEDAGSDQPLIGGIDITVQRNAFGRQRESFETDILIPEVGREPLHAVFIRAPVIKRLGNNVLGLATTPCGRTVAARQSNLLVSSFHPELTDDPRMHRYFVGMVERRA